MVALAVTMSTFPALAAGAANAANTVNRPNLAGAANAADTVDRLNLADTANAADTSTANGAASATIAQAGKVTDDTVELELRQDGVLHVKETVTFEGGPPTRSLVGRTRYDESDDRLYQVVNLKGDATMADATIVLKGSGTAKLEYDVKGAVTPLAAAQELRWYAVGGWSVPVEQAKVTLSGPAQLQNLSCFAGR